MQSITQLYLASASPRRRELLTQLGLRFELLDAAVEEKPAPQEMPADCVARLAKAKAEAGAKSAARIQSIPVLGADTIVVVDSNILGKPADEADAARMLRLLSGRDHQVMTAVAVCHAEQISVRTAVSDVRFKLLSDVEISAYSKTGEYHDKAGSYAIQGIAGMFVERMAGSYSAIVGLPLFETALLLREVGVEVL